MHARTTAGAPSASALAPPNFLTSTCVMLRDESMQKLGVSLFSRDDFSRPQGSPAPGRWMPKVEFLAANIRAAYLTHTTRASVAACLDDHTSLLSYLPQEVLRQIAASLYR